MIIEKKNNYLCISEIEDFSEAVTACTEYSDKDFSAVVFCIQKSFELSNEQKDQLISLPVITAVFKKDLSDVSLNSLITFDLRFSETVFKLTEENVKNTSKDRFEIIFGKHRDTALGSAPGTELEFVSVNSESCDEYFTRIFKDKNSVQIGALAECLTAVRTGNTEKGFEKESSNFFRLIKEKIKE